MPVCDGVETCWKDGDFFGHYDFLSDEIKAFRRVALNLR